MDLRIYLAGDRVGPQFNRAMQRFGARARTAMESTARDAAKNIEARGSADIAAAGHFGTRWTTGLHAQVDQAGADEIDINVYHEIPYAGVFLKTTVISGKPWLAIPLSFANVPRGMWARDYPGGLFRVDRKAGGAPLLFSKETREPKYFLIESVTIPKKWKLIEICREVASELRNYYKVHFSAGS